MPLDKLVDSAWLDSGLTSIANAIRARGQTENALAFPGGFMSAVDAIPWVFQGDKCKKIAAYDTQTILLKNTTFPTWTPSTTAATIKSSTNAGTFVADMANHDYMLRWRCRFDAAYKTGATLKAQCCQEMAEIWQAIFRRPNSLDNIAANNFNGTVCITLYTTPLNVYWNTNGAKTYTYSISYGIYPAATAATFSSATADSPTVTVKRPSWSARCSNTYFATARAPELDTDNSTIKIYGEAFETERGAALRTMYGGLVDLYNNPL